MQFSIARLLLITLFVNFIVAATFVFPPTIGVSVLTFVALFIVPPFIIVGVVNTRGLRQSFFLGVMISGTAHFVINVYIAVMLLISFADGGVNLADFDDDNWIQYLNGAGFLLGSIGGVSGMAAYYSLKLGDQKKVPQMSHPIDSHDESRRPNIYPESGPLPTGKEPALPR